MPKRAAPPLRIRLRHGDREVLLELEGLASASESEQAVVAVLDALNRALRVLVYVFAFVCLIVFIARYHPDNYSL